MDGGDCKIVGLEGGEDFALLVGGLLLGEFVLLREVELEWEAEAFEVVDHLQVKVRGHMANVEQHVDQLDVATLAEVGVDEAGPALLFAFRTRSETVTRKVDQVDAAGVEEVDSGGLPRLR